MSPSSLLPEKKVEATLEVESDAQAMLVGPIQCPMKWSNKKRPGYIPGDRVVKSKSLSSLKIR